jgi:hypothetical protein
MNLITNRTQINIKIAKKIINLWINNIKIII